MKKLILSLLITIAIAGGSLLGWAFTKSISPKCACHVSHCSSCNCK